MSTAAAILLGLFYGTSGTLKLCPSILPDVYKFQAAKFEDYAQVFPLRPLGYTPDPQFYMFIVGCIELSLGACLVLGPRPIKRLACLGLMFLMTGAAQTVIFNKEYPLVAFPTVCFAALYWLYSQLAPKVKDE